MKVRLKIESGGRAGLSLVELLVLLAVIAVIALIGFGTASRPMKTKSPGMRCVNNLKNIGLSFRIFATDNNDLFPARLMVSNGVELTSIDLLKVYRSLSNELSTPKLLHCWSDTKRKVDDWSRINFDTITAKNISYFTSLSADETMPQVILGGDRNLATNGVAVGSGFFAMGTNAPVGWTKEMHVEQGNVVMSDGSVQQMSSSRLKASLPDQDIATNYLVIP